MDLLIALEASAPSRLLRGSFLAYPLVNAFHIGAVGFLLAAVVLMDLRILGRFTTLPARPFVAAMRRVALLAFGAAAASGLALFAVRATDYAGMDIFRVKLALIVVAVLNAVLLGTLMRADSDPERSPALRAGAALSFLLWPAVLICGRMIGFL